MAGLSFCNEDIFRWGNQEERKGLPGQPSPFIRGLNEVERGFWANELAAFVSGLAGMSSTRHKYEASNLLRATKVVKFYMAPEETQVPTPTPLPSTAT